MKNNIETTKLKNNLDIKKYGKDNIDFINQYPETEKITTLFNLEENTNDLSTIRNILDKIIVIDESNKNLNKLKNKLA